MSTISPNTGPATALPEAQPRTPRKRRWTGYAVVFTLYCIVFFVMFRNIIFAIPDILSGKAILNSDELVPFFDVHTQFLDQLKGNFNDLTNGYEFRVRYAIFTVWMRYYLLLPFTIVLSPLVGAFANFVTLNVFLRKILPTQSEANIMRAASLSVLLFYFILLYAKVIHFYTLIAGFTLFSIALLLLIFGLFYEERHPYIRIAAAHLLIVINPAIHYIVIYIFTFAIIVGTALYTGVPVLNEETKPKAKDTRIQTLKRCIMASILLLVCTIVPYALFIQLFVLKGIGTVADTIPSYFFLIKTSSIALLSQISLDTGAVIDGFMFGRYTIPYARIANSFYVGIALLVVTPTYLRSIMKKEKNAVNILFFFLLLSIWCAMGYAYTYLPSFHTTLGIIVNNLYANHDMLSNIIVKLASTMVQILRFPHRFQFITFAILIIMVAMGLIRMQRDLIEKKVTGRISRFITLNFLLPIIFFVPFFSHWEYRMSLLSGDFNEYLTPYPLGPLKEVKDLLDGLPEGKTIVLPPSEAQKRITDVNGVRHKFIDKFFIYYLNKPSYYYGLSAELDNKEQFFMVFWSMLNGTKQWVNILQDLKIRYVVLNKEVGPAGFFAGEYLTDIESLLPRNVEGVSGLFEKKFENQSFVVYEMRAADAPDELVYANIDWKAYQCLAEQNANTATNVKPLNSSYTELTRANVPILTSNPSKTAKDIYVRLHPETFFRPDISNIAFNKNIVPSSQYFTTIYSMFRLQEPGKYNQINMVIPGIYDTVTTSFIGLPKAGMVKFPLKVKESGTYNLYLRAMPSKNDISVQLDEDPAASWTITGSGTIFAKTETLYSNNPEYLDVTGFPAPALAPYIPKTVIPIGSGYSYVPLGSYSLEKGSHWLYFTKTDDNPIVIEGIAVLDENKGEIEIPPSFRIIPDIEK